MRTAAKGRGERAARGLKITAELLGDLYACYRGSRLFAEVYPNGVIVTDDQDENFAIFEPYFDAQDELGQWRGGDDVAWLAWALIYYGHSRHSHSPNADLFMLSVDEAGGHSQYLACGLLADAVGYYLTTGGKS